MSSSSTSSPSSSTSGSGQVPAIRTFQLDSGSIGTLSSSVNLFRGDVNLSQSLFTLPGRTQDSGLDVNLSIQYQSNVFRQATTWNRDAPTGVLGLGWSLPLTYIEAADQGSPVSATRQYTLYDNGSPNGLARQPQAPRLFTMDGSLAGGLASGQAVPAAVLEQFRGHGLALDAGAVVEGSGPWTIRDDVLEQLFALELDGGGLITYDGGEVYQLQGYQFWKVLYYPPYERWVVVTDTAVRRSFGGRSAPGNGIAWEVWWTGAGGLPVWTGPSTVTAGQTRAARAWYLVTVQDRFGSSIEYAYDTVEQQVGAGGLAFTKAVYLSRVTDVYSRTVDFSYGEKLWGSGETDPREYADPHRAVPSNDPSPYQDRYETRYLDAVTVRDTSGATLFTVRMTYDPRPELGGPEKAVANVTANTGQLQGDTWKRFLTGITLDDRDGGAQPGFEIGYWLQETAGSSPGALATLTYPEGGTAAYSYTRQDLDVCQRMIEVPRPAVVPKGASPRVYFGADYAAVCYYNQSSLELSFQVFTWAGSWLSWQLDDAILDTQGLDLTTLEVMAQSDILVLSFDRTAPAEKAVYAFQRDTARPGQWKPATIDGRTAGRNQPSLTYSKTGADVTFAGGDTFFTVSQMSRSTLEGSWDVVTFRWTAMAWTKETMNAQSYTWLTSGREYYATLDTGGRFVVHYLDGMLQWQDGPPATLSGLSTFDLGSVALAPGAALVAVSNLTSNNSQQNTYQVWIVQWNAAYTAAVGAFGPFIDQFGQGNAPTTWIPRVVADTLVAINGNLLRYNGGSWLENKTLNPPGAVPSGRTQRYAFGPDYAFQIIAPTTGVGAAEGMVLAFDPGQDSSSWGRTPAAPKQALPAQTSLVPNWPTSGGSDYAVLGPYLYFRGVSNNWEDVVAQDALADLGETLDSESLVNEGPAFLAYTTTQGDVQAILLANDGTFGSPVQFGEQRIVTPGRDGIAGPGVSPAGPQTFVGYSSTANSFNDADSIYLHRYTDNAVAGPITHYAATGLVIDDGYQDPMPTSFVPDPATAGCDASGQVVKYFQSTALPGSSDPAAPLYGKAVSFYLNGLNDLTGDNYYDMLDGMLIRTETRDSGGALKASTAVTYQVFEQVALDPENPAAQPIQLRGGWVAQISQESFQDGVTTTQTSAYVAPGFSAPFTSQPASQATTSFGGSGKPETLTRTTSYGAQIDAGLQAIHALDDPAQQTSTRTGDDGTVLVQVMATTWSPWPSALGDGVLASDSEASFGLLDAASGDFPYSTYEPGEVPAGWTLAARTTRRTPYGQEQENVDSLGVPTATLYALDGLFAVAQVSNAPYGGVAWLGFQSYEDTSAWTLRGVTYDEDDARTGTRSAVLPGGAAASAAVTVTPRNVDSPYLVGCWYKTPAGFSGGDNAGWTVTVTGQSPIFVPFDDTGDEWAYRTIPVPLPPGGGLSVALSAANGSGQDVRLDSLFVGPLVNGLTARTFDTATQQPTATMDAGGRTSRTYFDRAGRPTVSVGASGQVREIAQRFLSRKGSPDGQFQPASPNAELTLHPVAGGVLETFRDGAAWRTRWSASGDWQEGGGVLTHTSTSSGTLTWIGQPAAGTWAVYFELQASDKPDLSITAGDVTVGYAGGQYMGKQGGSSWTPLVQPPDQARHWLLVAGDGVVLFFAEGQLLFSQKTRPAGTDLTIATSGAQASLRHLAVVEDIRLGISYNDAAGRQRQVQQLHADDSLVAEIVFDPLGRQVATTRNAPGSFGSGGELSVLQYSPGFLDVNAFLSSLTGNWQMTGDVADYYRGQTEGPVRRSDDQGYPYRGTRYEDSPRSTQLEQGRPGKPYAIDLTVPAADRQTLQYAWGANTGAMPDLPPGDYFQNTLTSPVKTGSVQITDKNGQLVAALYNDSEGALVSQTAGNRTYTDGTFGPEASLTTQLPNATTSGPQSDPSGYQEVSTVDGLQRTTALSDPDSGQTQFVSDSSGRLRFVQPALDSGPAWFLYYKYDPLGRMVEEGTAAGAWDRATLMELAEDQSWPNQDMTVSVASSWDGDGADPRLIGMKHRTVSYNPAPAADPDAGACTVTETFGYDGAGRNVSVRLQTEGAVAADGTVGYAYNGMGDVTRLDLPAGATPAAVFYGYNDQGRITAAGTSAGGADLGAFTYTPDGDLQTQALGGGAWQQAIDYASPGWPLSMTTRSADGSQSLGFTYTYEADGAVQSRATDFSFTGTADQDAETFAYDGQRRLLSATGTHDVAFTQYDPNGNIWSVDQDGVQQSFPLQPGSDRLQSVTIGGDTSSVAYNARGQMTSGMGRTLTYDPCTAMTTSISTSTGSGSSAIRLAYGGVQQRVFKQVRKGEGQDVVYFCGAGQFPVARLQGGAWSVLVQGPAGLLAMHTDRLLFPLADITQSTWAVVDSGKLAARYVYLPFGQQAVAEDGDGIAFPYLYQGQEWDAQVGLYNFRARMYDPVLRRLLSPDPARQFASLYVFAGNDPLTVTDPTGDISVWAQAGIGIAMAAVTAIGFGLTLFTGGASDAAAAALDTTLLTAEAGGEAVAAGAVEAGAAGSATEVAAGVSATEAAAATTSTTSLSTTAVNVLGSTMFSAGTSGFEYDIQHGRDFTAKGFFEALGIGAASGLVSGVLGAAGGALTKGMGASAKGWGGVAKRVGTKALVGGVRSLISSDVSTVLTNVAQHQPLYQGLIKSSVLGFGLGFGAGAGAGAWGDRTNIAKISKVWEGRIQRVTTLVDQVQTAATSTDAPGVYGTAAFFLISSYAVWGAADNWGQG
ncbi:MAG: large repetitive protein [Acidobacteriota bacterium]|jgi:RHS repeat-associated protein|nr:large repetitive protein [Acidobacteriota bacterium]